MYSFNDITLWYFVLFIFISCVCCVLWRKRHLRRADHSLREVLPEVCVCVSNCVSSRNLKKEAAWARVGLLLHQKYNPPHVLLISFCFLSSFERTTMFKIQKFCKLITLQLRVCTALRTNSNFCLYCINCLVFITEVENVYCAVRFESLYNTDTIRL